MKVKVLQGIFRFERVTLGRESLVLPRLVETQCIRLRLGTLRPISCQKGWNYWTLFSQRRHCNGTAGCDPGTSVKYPECAFTILISHFPGKTIIFTKGYHGDNFEAGSGKIKRGLPGKVCVSYKQLHQSLILARLSKNCMSCPWTIQGNCMALSQRKPIHSYR